MKNNTQRAFVLFYTMLIMGAILGSVSFIVSINLKELKLSGVSRESVVAYYMAESGAECALYWILSGADFSTNGVPQGYIDDDNDSLTPPTLVDARCMNEDVDLSGGYFELGGGTDPCAKVTVTLSHPINISSRGYNTCAASGLQVERGVEIEY